MAKTYIGGEKPSYLTVDSDGHISDHHVDWVARFPAHLRDLAPQLYKDRGGRFLWVVEGSKLWEWILPPKGSRKMTAEAQEKSREGFWAFREGASNPDLRVKDLDTEGFDVAVVFAQFMRATLALNESPEVAVAFARAYTDYVHEYCSKHPKRLKGVAMIPLQDVQSSVAEVKRAKDLGMVGILMQPQLRGEYTWQEKYWPIFAEAERLGIPIAEHIQSTFLPGQEGLPNWLFRHTMNFEDSMRSTIGYIAHGVLDTFPKLKVAQVEAETGWLPFLLHRLEEQLEMLLGYNKAPKKAPEDYFKDGNMYLTMEASDRFAPHVVDSIGDNALLVGSDYNHFDGSSPYTVKIILDRKDISEETKRKILSDNPKRFWGL